MCASKYRDAITLLLPKRKLQKPYFFVHLLFHSVRARKDCVSRVVYFPLARTRHLISSAIFWSCRSCFACIWFAQPCSTTIIYFSNPVESIPNTIRTSPAQQTICTRVSRPSRVRSINRRLFEALVNARDALPNRIMCVGHNCLVCLVTTRVVRPEHMRLVVARRMLCRDINDGLYMVHPVRIDG